MFTKTYTHHVLLRYTVHGRLFVLLLWLSLTCLFGNTAIGHELNSHEVSLGIFHVHELSIAVGCAEPPYYGFDGFEGIEWELVSTALANAGHKARLYYLPAAEGISALEKGTVDGFWVCGSQRAPTNGYYLSAPLLPRRFVAISLASSNLQIDTLEDLSRYKVAFHPSLHTTLEPEIKQVIAHNPLTQSVSNHELLIMFLFSRRIDVLITERNVYDYHLKKISPRVDTEQPVVFHDIFKVQHPRLVFRDQVLRNEFDKAWHELLVQKGLMPMNIGDTPESIVVTETNNEKNTQ